MSSPLTHRIVNNGRVNNPGRAEVVSVALSRTGIDLDGRVIITGILLLVVLLISLLIVG